MLKDKLSNMEQKMLDLMIEETSDENDPKWEQIAINGEASIYAVSNVGDVVNMETGQFLNPYISDQGYCVVSMYHRLIRYKARMHRLVAIAFIPNPENKPEVNHLDGNKEHNWYKNLEWATSAENKQHAIAMGLYADASFNKVGTDRSNTIYTDAQVHAVCKLLEQGKQPREIAETLKVSTSLPASIKYYGKWKHISHQYSIPKAGESQRRNGLLYNSKKNSHKQIHQICKLLEQGKQPRTIATLLGIKEGVPNSIKQGRAWGEISKLYKIPKTVNRNEYAKAVNAPSAYKSQIISMLTAGVIDYGEILRKLGLPDDRVNRKYIALVKFQLKDQSSTTIENVIGSDENRSDDK